MTININGTTGISGVDGSASTPALQGSDTNTGISFGTDEVAINTGGTARVTVNSSGNVGIANSSPTQKLDVIGNVKLSGIVVLDNNQAVQWGSSNTARITGQDAAGGGVMAFLTSGAERARITGGGDFFISTTSAPSTSNFGTQFTGGRLFSYGNVGATTSAAQLGGNAGQAWVYGDGDLENTNNRYTGLSDARFKDNIVDARSQWDDIKTIRIRNYNLIETPDKEQIGVVAQEIETISPGLVVEREHAPGETHKSVAYSVLYMKAVKALQEAMERIETLEAEVQTLKGGN